MKLVEKLIEKLIGGSNLQSTEREIIEAFNHSRVRFGDLYPVLEYREKDGLYVTKTGIGFILSLLIPPYLGEDDEKIFEALISFSHPDNTVIGFFSFADPNIKPFLDSWRDTHQYFPNVDNPEIVKKIVEERYNYYLKASREGFWHAAKPRIFKNWLWIFYPFQKDKDPFQLLDMVKKHKTRIEGLLRTYAPKNVTPQEFVNTLKSLINPSFEGWNNVKNTELNLQIPEHDLVIRIENEENSEEADLVFTLNGKKRYWRGFHVDVFPRRISLWEFSNIFFPYNTPEASVFLYEPFMFSLIVRVKDPTKRKEILRSKAMYSIQSAERNPLAKFFPSIMERAQEAQYILKLIEDGKLPYQASLFFFLSAPSKSELEMICAEFYSKMHERNFEIKREIDVALVNSFFECLPLGTIPERNDLFMRYTTLFSVNIASIVPFIGQVPSSPEPINLYVDRKFGIFGFNRFYSKTNYNKITVAESGGGKSFSQGDDQVLSLARGCIVRVIDKGRSYEELCKLIGGEFIDFSEDKEMCFNPFTKASTDENGNLIDEEFVFLTSIIGILAGYDLSEKDIVGEGSLARIASFIIRAIEIAWNRKGKDAGVRDVFDALIEMEDESGEGLPKKIAEGLHPFAVGPYARFFNGKNNVNYSKDYVVLELESLSGKDTRLQIAIITTLIVQILREFMLSFRKEEKEGKVREKILYVDEAWELFKKASIANFLELAARTFRKYRASLEVISQTYQDFLSGESQRAIFNNSAHILGLYPKKSDVLKAHKEGTLPFSDFETELLASLTTVPGRFSEFYLSSVVKGIGRLIVDRFSYWIFTTSGKEREIRTRAIRKFGRLKGLEILAGKKPIAEMLLEKNLITSQQYITAIYLQNTPLYKGKSPEEILILMGAVSEETIKMVEAEIEKQLEVP